jgi:hypothetical protein
VDGGPQKEVAMSHILADGPVSDIQRGSETQGAGSTYRGTGSMQVATNQLTIMRIGSQPAELKSKNMFIVKEGERVIAAGKLSGGVLKIGAARNLTAGTGYTPPIMAGWIVVAMSMLLGIPLSFVLIGLPIVGFGIYILILTLGWKKSLAMVEAAARTPRPLTATPQPA